MALKDILLDLATIGAIKLDDETQLTYTTYRINEAAKELFNENDLNGSLVEQVFNCNINGGMQISLPNYVGRIRAVRYYYPQLNLRTTDMRPKYAARMWQSNNMLSWRMKGEKPIMRDISNASLITATFRLPVTVATQVTIAGTTDNADQVSETLFFAVGDSIKVTTKSFDDISDISKDVVTDSNCDITDVDGNMLASIANNQAKSLYHLVQVINLPNSAQNATTFQPISDYVELLWKIRFKPFVNVTDEFMCPGYDTAIKWKYLEHKARLMSTPDLIAAEANKAQADKIIKDQAYDEDQTKEMSMNFGTNATYDAFETISSATLAGFYPSNSFNNPSALVWP